MEKQTVLNTNRVVYLVDGARSPFLKMRGVPGPFSAADLAVNVGKSLLMQQKFAVDLIDEAIIGCVAPSAEEANIARIIALRLGCNKNMPAWTVQRNCASGLQAIDSARRSIMLGQSDIVLAGGTEAMSHAPLLFDSKMVVFLAGLQKSKKMHQKIMHMAKFRPGFLAPVIGLLKGLTDPVVNMSMGQTAEELAYMFNISHRDMDEFSVQSHQRASQFATADDFEKIIPLYDSKGKCYEKDDGIRDDSSVEKLSKLRPVFDKYGNVTAGNSSQVTDGAALLILASEDAVKKHNLPVIAKLSDVAWGALDPKIMGLGPVHAMTPLLQNSALKLSDIDRIEINEAFAAQVLACRHAWQDQEYCKEHLNSAVIGEIPMDKLNPEGGAIAIGHPVGASGARLVLHAAMALKKYNQERALISLCIGGGQGGGALIERSGL